MNSMLQDDRPIVDIVHPNGNMFIVGIFGITKIEIYAEPGQMGVVPWAAIWKGDWLSDRVDIAGWRIHYHVEKPDDPLSV